MRRWKGLADWRQAETVVYSSSIEECGASASRAASIGRVELGVAVAAPEDVT
jgi:hypothetical protein